MSQMNKFDISESGLCVEITDPKEIARLDKLEPFISKDETLETFDKNAMINKSFVKSSKIIGQRRPVDIAVWYDDPNRSTNSPFRVHLRVIDGRHRILQDEKWTRKYYDLGIAKDPVMNYFILRHHFDLQKHGTQDEDEVLIEQMTLYLNKKHGLSPAQCYEKISRLLVPHGVISEQLLETKRSEQVKKQNLQKKVSMKRVMSRSVKQSLPKQSEYDLIKNELKRLQSRVRILSNLETVTTVAKIKIHAKVDAVNNQLVVEQVTK